MTDYGLVSVVIPVYNVEKYLRKCLESVCAQTYKNLEILVVDDQSPDSSGKIADGFACSDKRVKVFHINNKGAAGARNYALKRAAGDYITFVDSDDWIEENEIERLMQELQKHNCDIAQCQYMDEYTDRSVFHTFMDADRVITDEEFVEDMLLHWEDVLIWNKLFRRECLQDVTFVEGRCIDDEFFTYRAIMRSKRIVLLHEAFYHYRLRKSGAMGNREKRKQRLQDQIAFVTERYPVLAGKYPALEAKVLVHMLEVLMSVMQNGADFKDVYRTAFGQYRRHLLRALLMKGVPAAFRKSLLVFPLQGRKRLLRSLKNQEQNWECYYE